MLDVPNNKIADERLDYNGTKPKYLAGEPRYIIAYVLYF